MTGIFEPLLNTICSQGTDYLPDCDVESTDIDSLIPRKYLQHGEPGLPEVSEVDVVRHFTRLSRKNYSVDTGFYPLGSCTMKYNPKVNEDISQYSGFSMLHPYAGWELSQGALEIMYYLEEYLCEISAMDKITLQPAAGAHGELTGLMLVKAYHESRGEGNKRTKVLIPDSAHGTNPASSSWCGYDIIELKSDSRGNIDIKHLKSYLDNNVAALLLTNPNTLGLFEENIIEIAELVHNAGALLYYDGANLNALLGKVRVGDMGVDVMHFNLHKTFSTPHGGGGPGSGPVGVKAFLAAFLPVPVVCKKKKKYILDYNRPKSIGKVKSFYGNFGVLIRAYAYILSLGADGLKAVSENAVLNANYLLERLKVSFDVPYNRRCMHEFVLSLKDKKAKGVSALDVAKRLIDYGYHPPTIYFPLIVTECFMIEPTETESKKTLDEFTHALIKISDEIDRNPELLIQSPHSRDGYVNIYDVSRVDEVKAAREPVLHWMKEEV